MNSDENKLFQAKKVLFLKTKADNQILASFRVILFNLMAQKLTWTNSIRKEEKVLAELLKKLIIAKNDVTTVEGVSFTPKHKEIIKNFFGESAVQRIENAKGNGTVSSIKDNIQRQKETLRKAAEQQRERKIQIGILIKLIREIRTKEIPLLTK